MADQQATTLTLWSAVSLVVSTGVVTTGLNWIRDTLKDRSIAKKHAKALALKVVNRLEVLLKGCSSQLVQFNFICKKAVKT
ncbi:MAG: hypothetical protein ABSG46_04660 [Candidatus Binataceae bacterium]|jgi:hypothetical protein